MYSNKAFLSRINSDLVNDLGNLVSRTTAMVEQYFGGTIPAPQTATEFDTSLIEVATGALDKMSANVDNLLIPEAIDNIWAIIRRANKYIDETCPWILAKYE